MTVGVILNIYPSSCQFSRFLGIDQVHDSLPAEFVVIDIETASKAGQQAVLLLTGKLAQQRKLLDLGGRVLAAGIIQGDRSWEHLRPFQLTLAASLPEEIGAHWIEHGTIKLYIVGGQ